MTYRHTQIGWLTLVVIGIAAVVGVVSTAETPGAGPKVLILVLFFALVLFSSLTTRVENRQLTISFGLGIIRRTIDLGDVRSVQVVRNSWLTGWGIRWTGTGWMWNVSGLGAVELEYKEGGRFRIGTDEPEQLAAAVRQHLDRR